MVLVVVVAAVAVVIVRPLLVYTYAQSELLDGAEW
jgi:hypothetical protein